MNSGSADDARRFEEVFEPVVAVTVGIRRRLRQLLGLWKVGDQVLEDTLVVVEELIANVIDHAGTPFRLSVRYRRSEVQIRVRDGSARLPRAGSLDPAALRGRGLRLVQALSQRWGWESEENGKTVWATLAVPS